MTAQQLHNDEGFAASHFATGNAAHERMAFQECVPDSRKVSPSGARFFTLAQKVKRRRIIHLRELPILILARVMALDIEADQMPPLRPSDSLPSPYCGNRPRRYLTLVKRARLGP